MRSVICRSDHLKHMSAGKLSNHRVSFHFNAQLIELNPASVKMED